MAGKLMITVNIHEAKARLSEYVAAVERGETVVIARRNVPVAEIRPLPGPRRQPRPLGRGPGEPGYRVPESFWEPLPAEVVEGFEGRAPDPPVPGVTRRGPG